MYGALEITVHERCQFRQKITVDYGKNDNGLLKPSELLTWPGPRQLTWLSPVVAGL